MDPRNLYTLRYRRGTTGVQTTLISASSQAVADRLGRWWCGNQINCRFIRTEPAITVDEAMLPADLEMDSASAKETAAARKKAEAMVDTQPVTVAAQPTPKTKPATPAPA